MPWVAAIGMLIVWELVCRLFNIREFILPAPSVIAKSLVEFRGPILEHSWWTLVTTLFGFALAIVGGVLLGVALGFSTLVYTGLYPLLVGFNAIPKVALVPILVLWFGIGAVPVVVT